MSNQHLSSQKGRTRCCQPQTSCRRWRSESVGMSFQGILTLKGQVGAGPMNMDKMQPLRSPDFGKLGVLPIGGISQQSQSWSHHQPHLCSAHFAGPTHQWWMQLIGPHNYFLYFMLFWSDDACSSIRPKHPFSTMCRAHSVDSRRRVNRSRRRCQHQHLLLCWCNQKELQSELQILESIIVRWAAQELECPLSCILSY